MLDWGVTEVSEGVRPARGEPECRLLAVDADTLLGFLEGTDVRAAAGEVAVAEKLADEEELEQPAQPKATMAATAEQKDVL